MENKSGWSDRHCLRSSSSPAWRESLCRKHRHAFTSRRRSRRHERGKRAAPRTAIVWAISSVIQIGISARLPLARAWPSSIS